MNNPRTIIITVAALIAAIIALQNLQPATIRFLFWDFSLPLIVLVFIILLAGYVIGHLTGASTPAKRKKAKGEEQRQS